MSLRRAALGLMAVVSLVALGAASPPPAPGYLAAGAAPDATRLLPPPPAHGSAYEKADEATFKATRKLEGQPRWTLATSDAAVGPPALLKDFGCALGVDLDASNAPVLSNLLARVSRDARAVIDPPKDLFARKRPFVGGKSHICVTRDASLEASASYPSGHSTVSWATGLILAELAPDRATEVLMRARAYGESRVVCGVHNPSDIEAGRTGASALVATLHGDAAFRADMELARAELAAVRAAGGQAPDAGRCTIENEAAAHRPW